jgi:hypothetical protein
MLEKLDLKGGLIVYNTFNIDVNASLEDQIYELREDLLQIKYGHYLVDVGFDSELDPEGFFKVVVIKGTDWFHPLKAKRIKKEELLSSLQESINFASQLNTESIV